MYGQVRLNMTDSQQQAYGFLVSQAVHFESQVYKKQYPEFMYPKLVPVDTSAAPWVPAVVFSTTDQVGKAEFFHHRAKDMPMADLTREMFANPVHMAGIGYDYSIQEIEYARQFGINLTSDKADAARRAWMEFVEESAITGQASKGWTGLINNANVTRIDAIADGTGASRLWSAKTADQITRDINDALVSIWNASNTVEMADTVLLPTTAWAQMGSTRLANTDSTAWKYFRENNLYFQKTGQQPTVLGVRQLNHAGVAGVGRMVVYRYSSDILKMHMPMAHQFMPIWQRGPLVFEAPGIFRLAGLEIRRPTAVTYVDGITPA